MDVFQRIEKMYQVNFAKIEKQIMAYYLGEPKMIKLSNGVEVSEETVVSALKKAGISVEPKHIFRQGDVAHLRGNSDWPTEWRLIINRGYKGLYSVDYHGVIQGDGSQAYFERYKYVYSGRQENLL